MINPELILKLKPYESPILRKSVMQIVNTLIPLLCLITFMLLMMSKDIPYWFVLLFVPITTIFFVRTFIILHDCGHNSFFKSLTACKILGSVCGFVTFMPFFEFQHSHGIHHANAGKLERRGVGDVWTLTVDEYRAAGKLTRFVYRGFRDPFVFLIIGPLLLFFVFNRLPSRSSQKKQIWNIVAVDIFLIALLVGSYFTVGLWNFVLVMGPVLFLAEDAGIWLFFIQHQFENTYWEHSGQWDPLKSALEGSSFYKLPKVLQWATGNIGFHHIHHLKPRIPNYRLNQCFNEVEELQEVKPIRLLESLKAMSFRLWDEHQRKLIKLSKMNLTNKHGRNLRFSEINNLDFPFREGF